MRSFLISVAKGLLLLYLCKKSKPRSKIWSHLLSSAMFRVDLTEMFVRALFHFCSSRQLKFYFLKKEVILSFNEISLSSGIEVAKIMANKADTLNLLDLNGNMFGEEGKEEILSLLKPIGNAFSSLSEDEGSEGEEEDEDHFDEGEEEEEEEEDSEVVVGEEDYDEVEDYEEYEGEEEEEEEEEGEELDSQKLQDKFGSFNIVQQQTVQPSLFRPFTTTPSATTTTTQPNKPFQLTPSHINFSQMNLNNQPSAGNLFSNIVANSPLITNSIPNFDNFIKSPNLNSLKSLDDASLQKLAELEKFNAKFLLSYLSILAKLFDKSSPESGLIIKNAQTIIGLYFQKKPDQSSFGNEFLTHFGCIKSEEKKFHAIELDEKMIAFLAKLFKENCFPVQVKQNILNYLTLRMSNEAVKNEEKSLIKRNTQTLISCLN